MYELNFIGAHPLLSFTVRILEAHWLDSSNNTATHRQVLEVLQHVTELRLPLNIGAQTLEYVNISFIIA